MALQGKLRDFSVTQLLNLINLACKTGTLTIFQAIKIGEMEHVNGSTREQIEAGPKRAQVSFKTGKLIFASMKGQDRNLIAVLNKLGKLTDEQAQVISEQARDKSDKALAQLLLNANYVTQNDIVESIQQQMQDVIYSMMVWNATPFRFDDHVMPPDDRILVSIDLETIIMEGSGRMKEVKELNQRLPNLDFALSFRGKAQEKLKGIELSIAEWRVVQYVNSKNSIRQIARANNMSEIEIRRVVYGLVQAGLVEVVKAQTSLTIKLARLW